VLARAAPVTHLESAMNIELEEVVVQDVSDDALELAAGGAQGGADLEIRCSVTASLRLNRWC
jgi:hypothetical protein